MRASVLTALVASVSAADWQLFDDGWKFTRGDSAMTAGCKFGQDLGDTQCQGLSRPSATAADQAACAATCCAAGEKCQTWQWCPEGAKCADENSHGESIKGCWIGTMANCANSKTGWISRARVPAPAPTGPVPCATLFCKKNFNDQGWTDTETPHDWAIEDLPGRAIDTDFPVLEVRNGSWLFTKGDSPGFANTTFNDKGWTDVTVPHDWRDPPTSVAGDGVIGWYRRHITVTAAQVTAAEAGTLKLGLGTVATTAAVYLNGLSVGVTGSFDKPDTGCKDYLDYRAFGVPAGTLVAGANVIALRIMNGMGDLPGGLYDSMAPDFRSGPFDPASSPGQHQTGYTVSGVGWYRKTFESPGSSAAGRTVIRFDGVYMHADVYVNEVLVGSHPYGYTTFEYDITDHIGAPGASNLLAVRVASMGSNSRWYAGAGIFRHVHLGTVPAVHAVTFGGVGVTTPQHQIDLVAKTATVGVTTAVHNAGKAAAATTVGVRLFSPAGELVAESSAPMSIPVQIAAGATVNVTQALPLTNVAFWGPDTPHLYLATVTVTSTTGTDAVNVSFGVRHITFDSTNGFRLNGAALNLKGGCVHHDNGPLGSRSIDRAEERRVETLKANGYNAIRTSHNPVSPAFVAACDRLGMLLMEEAFDCWDDGKNPDDYHLYFDEWWQRDIFSMVMRDRNSPSIVMWSIGNEIPMRRTPKGIAFSKQLADYVRALDPMNGTGRAVTSAYPGVQEDTITDQFLAPLDVAGYNYGWPHYAAGHARVPSRVIAGTESFPMQSFQTWKGVTDNAFVIGDFIWTAIDYIGESAIGGTGFNTPSLKACGGYCPQGWSWHVSFCGDIDLVGHRKPQSYYRNVLWGVSDLEVMVHAPVPAGQREVVASWGWPMELPSWTWDAPAATNLSVNIYSTHASVQLLINGKPVGAAPVPVSASTEYTATFVVPYSTGSLTAIGYDAAGKAVTNKTIVTAGKAAAIKLTPDRAVIRADRSDLSYVTAEIVDANGVLLPTASIELTFQVTGASGELAAVGSGDPADAGSFYQGVRATYLGKAVAIVRPGTSSTAPAAGDITLQVTGGGMTASVDITVTVE